MILAKSRGIEVRLFLQPQRGRLPSVSGAAVVGVGVGRTGPRGMSGGRSVSDPAPDRSPDPAPTRDRADRIRARLNPLGQEDLTARRHRPGRPGRTSPPRPPGPRLLSLRAKPVNRRPAARHRPGAAPPGYPPPLVGYRR